MFLDIVGVITTSKLSILSTFQGGAPGAPPPCQVGLRMFFFLNGIKVIIDAYANMIIEFYNFQNDF